MFVHHHVHDIFSNLTYIRTFYAIHRETTAKQCILRHWSNITILKANGCSFGGWMDICVLYVPVCECECGRCGLFFNVLNILYIWDIIVQYTYILESPLETFNENIAWITKNYEIVGRRLLSSKLQLWWPNWQNISHYNVFRDMLIEKYIMCWVFWIMRVRNVNRIPRRMSWWRHQMETFPRYRPFVWGIHRSPVYSLHKGQWRGALMFSLICAWRNAWVKNCEASDLRRHRAHYDVTVMCNVFCCYRQRCYLYGPNST